VAVRDDEDVVWFAVFAESALVVLFAEFVDKFIQPDRWSAMRKR
jgi:hypothetical protein